MKEEKPKEDEKRKEKNLSDSLIKEKRKTEEKAKEENGEKAHATRFVKPTISDVQKYINEKGYQIDAQKFYDHYELVGWVYGKGHQRVKDWKAAVRTWVRNEHQYRNVQTTILTDNSIDKYDEDNWENLWK